MRRKNSIPKALGLICSGANLENTNIKPKAPNALFVLAALLSVFVAKSGLAANDNEAHIIQNGEDNIGEISQTGNFNKIGTVENPISQTGRYNKLEITQTGFRNEVGADLNFLGSSGFNLYQFGDSATPLIFNEILIGQQSNDNAVNFIYQEAVGDIPEGANRLSVLQGSDSTGAGNVVNFIIQQQNGGMPGQVARIEQAGENNVIDRVEQRSLTAADFEENIVRVKVTGDSNGIGDLTGAALASRAEFNSLVQSIGYDNLGANGNFMDLLIEGDSNRFGIYQGGRKNTVGLVSITSTGENNQIGFRQDGLENDITMSVLEGSDNNVGIGQIGTNRASVDLIGIESLENSLLGLQEGTNDLFFTVKGSENTARADQGYHSGMGGDNVASFRLEGDNNFFNLSQRGSASFKVVVKGDQTNTFAPTLFTAVGNPLPMAAGEFLQEGMNNFADLGITGDRNAIGTWQKGSGNRISSTTSGNLNQAAFVQAGINNRAYLNQSGNDNTAVFMQ